MSSDNLYNSPDDSPRRHSSCRVYNDGYTTLKVPSSNALLTYLPTTRNKVSARKPRNLKAGSSRKTKQPPAASHKKPSHGRSGADTVHHKAPSEEPYIYECTRPGCGYRIWRDDKAGEGEHRFDLKCPKCHNKEFRCLGKGDLPNTFEDTIPTPMLDFDKIDPIDLDTH